MKGKVSISHCFSNFLILESRLEAIKREVGGTYFGRDPSCGCKIDVLGMILVEIPVMGQQQGQERTATYSFTVLCTNSTAPPGLTSTRGPHNSLKCCLYLLFIKSILWLATSIESIP